LDDAIRYAEALETDKVWIEGDLTEFAPDKVWDKRPYEVKRPGLFRDRTIMKTADREEAIRAADSIRPPDAWVVNCMTHEVIQID